MLWLSPFFSRDSLILIGLCLLPILLYLPAMGSPFERDEGAYATIAQGILDGKVPYRDLFDNKPPLVYGWYALSFMLFGESVWAPRILAALLLSLTTLAIFGQAKLVMPRGVAYTAAAVFALSTGLPWVALHANTEAYMLLPLVTSLVAFTMGVRSGRLWWFVACGALGGLAVMTKQVAMWNVLALALVAAGWRVSDEAGLLLRLRPALLVLGGALGSIALVMLPFVINGSADDLMYANLSYNWLYVGALSFADRSLNAGYGFLLFFGVAAPVIVAGVAGLLALWRQRRRQTYYALAAWAVGSAVGVATGGRFFPHYFLHLLPALAILSAVVFYDGWRMRRSAVVSKPVIAVAVALIIISAGTNAVLYIVPRQAEHVVAQSVYYQNEWEEHGDELGHFVQRRTRPGDTIFNLGRESYLYFYADRQPPGRYFYDWAVNYDERNLAEMIADLTAAPPKLIIDSAQKPLFEEEAFELSHPPALMRFIDERYDYVGRIYFADVYELKASGEADTSEFESLVPDYDTFY
jgi:4-amino-4-deoxy-L-arabinose transferase-like glycosyltransferase